MNFGKFGSGRHKRLKRLIPFDQLPLAQQRLFRSLKDNHPSLWENRTPPSSPQSETEEEYSNNDRNPFLPRNFEIDPSNFRNNTLFASQQNNSDSILASDIINNTMSAPRQGISEDILASDHDLEFENDNNEDLDLVNENIQNDFNPSG
jgi:hypothetical protein